ncbi:MAG: TorF family putative porin [Thiohalocapsa sp.]
MKAYPTRTASAASALLAVSMISMNQAMAQDPWAFSANIGAVSNYIWRGVTQTGDQAAIQGGLDVAHESGFYAGTWISNVDFDEGASEDVVISPALDDAGMPVLDDFGLPTYIGETVGADSTSANYELDLYLGYGGAINDDFSYDIGAIYYAYPDGRDSDFAELSLSGTFKWFTLGLAYTIYGENDEGLFDDGDLYYFGGAEFALPYDFGFAARAGYYQFRNDDVVTGTLVDASGVVYDVTESADYWHFGASITREAGDFGTFSLNWDQNNGNEDVGYDTDPKFWVGWNKEF